MLVVHTHVLVLFGDQVGDGNYDGDEGCERRKNTATRIPKSKQPNCGLQNERAAADTRRTSEEARDKS